ncbi:MAG: MFS transporter [Tannerella sp.]|jgi:dipeptide/tripeptide permease|nr:MFS transporter [Tannerella sp.]
MTNVFRKLPRTFWVGNTLELFERWAWYGFYMLFANYLTGSSDQGGLEFSQSEKGLLMGVGTGILYFLPVLTGAMADRYGYRRMLLLAFLIYISAFLLMPECSSFGAVFLIFLYLALGAALFKPIVQATVAKATDEETSSIGFGLFYMMVNVGAFFGPLVTLLFKGSPRLVFYVSAVFIALNLLLLPFYKEPGREKPALKTEPLGKSFASVFRNMGSILKDGRFLLFLLIVGGFWAMYYQLFFTLPVFITQWVDTQSLYDFLHRFLPFFSNNYSPSPGVMDAEFITNFDALYIIFFQVVVSSIVMRLKPLRSMMAGILVCSIGMALSLAFHEVQYTLLALLIFSLGEMAASPKISEYIGRIAPADKKALYMGYSFIPVCLGSFIASYISGGLYQQLSDKVSFTHAFVAAKGLHIADGLSSNAYFEEAARQAGLTPKALTRVLWDTYDPSRLWLILLLIGLLVVACLYLYDRTAPKKPR